MAKTNLVSYYGVAMARYPELCAAYGPLKNVPNHELEKRIQIRGNTDPSLKGTHEYTQLLRYCFKRDAELIRMYATDGDRSIDRYNLTHYHALIVRDNTRIRLFYEYKVQRAHVRGWREHYTYVNAADLYNEDPQVGIRHANMRYV